MARVWMGGGAVVADEFSQSNFWEGLGHRGWARKSARGRKRKRHACANEKRYVNKMSWARARVWMGGGAVVADEFSQSNFS